MPKPLRIAGASGFRGDRNDALLDQLPGGPVHFVLLDYPAEIPVSSLRVKRMRDPKALEPALGDVVARGERKRRARHRTNQTSAIPA